ncbi:heavy metal translocating P-type ATPase [Enterococcus dongliensis]|uniref:P-type Cu(+) transporter n=2 Tax=Enterococcus dongliensis TaxID=2559925 RepID=A0AAP5KN61_9ENTE|nr:heavy metal translocating P-type ATPase [Enterococcus dongliensis]MDT2595499.1 heavy metal translocating P-type ATPase [Enterococcus dongliensis]MDT2603286.1 heavy metal translocating P-type ATPase [Enterococcus dongliensis]MDT2633648.1 heavy metal translocating P-type ATPase [Enterococcus dongliensis]MDT2635978.1 heavy metal translocating P-type ATPase [Enterococcus dongliensis]MDT2639748.1 heavy metal translocating P-type ATPase [Enterococcus dongliensis]
MEMDHSKHHPDSSMDGHKHHEMTHKMNGHDHGDMDHSMHMGNFKQKFWLSLVLSIPIIILSPMMGIQLPFQFTFPGSEWVVLVLATILFIYGGQPFLSGAKMELKMKSPAMMTLIAMGISVAYIYSVYSFIANKINPHEHVMDFFWELATLIVIMLLGHWVEMNAVSNASNALKKLAELLPDEVNKIEADGTTKKVKLQEIHHGDQLLVRAGDKMPTDGEIIDGSTIADESAVTGESKGVQKNIGDSVIGGSVNGDGTIKLKVTGTGADGYLAKVMTMVKQAQQEKSKLESISDKVAKWLFYIALIAGIVTFVAWLILEDLPQALDRMVTVFVIACPHALGLAIPLVIARSTSLAAKNGLLLKSRQALEQGNQLDYVFLDKTGTLTEGKFTVTGVEVLADSSREESLKYIGALEAQTNHPLAVGVMNYLKSEKIDSYQAEDVSTIKGVGVSGTVEGHQVVLANQKEVEKRQLSFDQEKLKAYQEQGNTISFLLIDEKLIAFFAMGDTLKDQAQDFIKNLRAVGIEPVMLTGDNQEAAKAVAEYLSIKEFYSELLPDDKEKIIKQYTDKGKKVMMVGDGINDAPALARASIGMAIGAGTDIAIDSADVVLTNSNLQDILKFVRLAKKTHSKMIQNLWWGAGYNILAIPLAAGVLAPIGILLSPAVGAILMSLSTIIVAINAMTLNV